MQVLRARGAASGRSSGPRPRLQRLLAASSRLDRILRATTHAPVIVRRRLPPVPSPVASPPPNWCEGELRPFSSGTPDQTRPPVGHHFLHARQADPPPFTTSARRFCAKIARRSSRRGTRTGPTPLSRPLYYASAPCSPRLRPHAHGSRPLAGLGHRSTCRVPQRWRAQLDRRVHVTSERLGQPSPPPSLLRASCAAHGLFTRREAHIRCGKRASLELTEPANSRSRGDPAQVSRYHVLEPVALAFAEPGSRALRRPSARRPGSGIRRDGTLRRAADPHAPSCA